MDALRQALVSRRTEYTTQWRSAQSLTICPRTGIPTGIFGVPLQHSIRYANVAISLFNDEGQSYIYGYVPIVVAKCGVYLKEKGAPRHPHHFGEQV